jgi:glycerol-3-phosphate dehydrogenase
MWSIEGKSQAKCHCSFANQGYIDYLSFMHHCLNSQGLSSNSTSAGLRLISEDISQELGIVSAVLMGANLAPEVANDNV